MVRIKHRYLLVDILYPSIKPAGPAHGAGHDEEAPFTVQIHRPSPARFDAKLLLKMIRNGVAELFGDYGSGMIAGSLQVKYFSQATSTAIIRVSRDHYRLVWAALTFTTHLPRPADPEPCVMHVVRVSGTIKKAEEEAIRRARASIRRVKRINGQSLPGTFGAGNVSAGASAEFDEQDEAMDISKGIEDVDEDDDLEPDSD